MSDSFLEKLKKSVIAGAHTSATKIEDAARIGKLRLDILAEKRKLAREYAEMGKEAHLAILENSLGGFTSRPGILEIQKNIENCKRTMADLELRLSQASIKKK